MKQDFLYQVFAYRKRDKTWTIRNEAPVPRGEAALLVRDAWGEGMLARAVAAPLGRPMKVASTDLPVA